MENEIVKIKKYTIEHHHKADGSYHVVRTCDGFNALELLGICELTRDSITKQISGYLPQPTEIERNIVKGKRATVNDIMIHPNCNYRLSRLLKMYVKEYNTAFADEIDIMKISKFWGAGFGSIKLLKEIINDLKQTK